MTAELSKLNKGSSAPVAFTDVMNVPKQYNLLEEAVPIHVVGNITNMGGFYYLEAKMTATLKFNCDKCLEQIEYFLEETIQEKYSDSVQNDEFWMFTGNTIDFKPALESNFLLGIPMSMLCKDDCKGLCFTCGHNLNESACNCKDTYFDPRFDILRSESFRLEVLHSED